MIYPKGVIFFHEFSSESILKDQINKKSTDGVNRAFYKFFNENKINYKAKFLYGNLALILPNVKNKLFSFFVISILLM